MSNMPGSFHAHHSVISTLNESGVYITGLVNHRQMAISLETRSNVSVRSKKMSKRSGTNWVNIKPVCCTLTTASLSAIIILRATAIRLRIWNADVTFSMIVARNRSHAYMTVFLEQTSFGNTVAVSSNVWPGNIPDSGKWRPNSLWEVYYNSTWN